jgi:hypothetical protein
VRRCDGGKWLSNRTRRGLPLGTLPVGDWPELDLFDSVEATVDEVDPSDRMLFETAVVEIVGNLVEHARTPDGTPVTITAHVAVHPDRVEARLADDALPTAPPHRLVDT